MYPIFDGHNDFLTVLSESSDRKYLWPKPSPHGHLDLERMRSGGFVGGLFAIWVPSVAVNLGNALADGDGAYRVPLAEPVSRAEAQPHALRQAAALLWMERMAPDEFRVCRSGSELKDAIKRGQIAAIMHMEGAEAIDEDLYELDVWYAAGLRSLGPVWSRSTVFGHGVPFAYPCSPDIGRGLTSSGARLIRRCDQLGILIDVSHLNEKGFNDVARISSQPLVATHSNSHSISSVARNLTDRQLQMIGESDGLVGFNFAAAMISPKGQADLDLGFDMFMRHFDHMLELVGEDCIALGSDYDGARIPKVIGDVRGGQALCRALLDHGYGEDLVRKIASKNWLDKLEKWLG